jgi:hypothetical protein
LTDETRGRRDASERWRPAIPRVRLIYLTESLMRSFTRLLLAALACLCLGRPALAAPAEGDLETLYLVDTQLLDTNAIDRLRPRTVLVPVSMDGVRYENSLGMRASKPGPVYATFGLGRRYGRFQAQVGLPDNIMTKGRLVYEVEADGKRIWRSPILRAGDRSVAVDLDVSEAQRLTLRGQALDATEGYLIVWGDARVLPKGAAAAQPAATNDPRPATARPDAETALPLNVVDVERLAEALATRLLRAGDTAKGSVLLAEFQGIGVTRATVRSFTEELSGALIRRGVRLLERGQFAAELQKLQPDPDTPLSAATVKELGRRTGARVFLVGSLTGRANGLVIVNARALRADTGEAIAAERAEIRPPASGQ